MNPELHDVPSKMLRLGLGALAHALRLSFYYNLENEYWGEMSVLNAAHAAEILIKARIAQEHPLLIFEEVPRASQSRKAALDFEDLLAKGKTLNFADLPDRLWATTGTTVPEPGRYKSFGQLRNAIQHFAAHPQRKASERTLEFVFTVIDPFINTNWGLFAIDFNEEFGDHYEHVFDTLVRLNIRPLVSPEAARVWSLLKYEPGRRAPVGYAKWFQGAMKRALSG